MPYPKAIILCNNTTADVWTWKITISSIIGKNLNHIFYSILINQSLSIDSEYICGDNNICANYISCLKHYFHLLTLLFQKFLKLACYYCYHPLFPFFQERGLSRGRRSTGIIPCQPKVSCFIGRVEVSTNTKIDMLSWEDIASAWVLLLLLLHFMRCKRWYCITQVFVCRCSVRRYRDQWMLRRK